MEAAAGEREGGREAGQGLIGRLREAGPSGDRAKTKRASEREREQQQQQQQPLLTPILFIIFNRPEQTVRVFDAIRKARPKQLFIAADGPRSKKAGEKELCEAARVIAAKIDWPCEVRTRFKDKNIGCKLHVSSAISWFFEHVEEGIILEDDCLPVQSFFPYCTELLERYRNNSQIMHVSSVNFLNDDEITNHSTSYHFSRHPHVWGWATWRRAWNKYDLNMTHLDTLINMPVAKDLFLNKKYLKFWINFCKNIRDKNIDTWDAQWQYTLMYNNGCAITPHFNLIENIGFGADATHTKDANSVTKKAIELTKPLNHPKTIYIDKIADAHLAQRMYMRSLWKKIILKLQLLK